MRLGMWLEGRDEENIDFGSKIEMGVNYKNIWMCMALLPYRCTDMFMNF
jgi:hypothetical protein